MLPIRTDSPLRSRPWMNWLLVAANVAIMLMLRPWPGLFQHYQLNVHTLEVHHFITYAFLHEGWLHLLVNMVVLYILGNSINDRLGQLGYLAFYLGAAVFSAIGFLAVGGEAMVGASGAVGAIMGAYLALFPRSTLSLSVIIASIEVPSMYFVIILFIYNVIMSLAQSMGVQQVAYEAHIAGMLFGFIVAMGLLLARGVPRQPFDFLALVQRWIRRRQYRQLVARGYDPFAIAPGERGSGARGQGAGFRVQGSAATPYSVNPEPRTPNPSAEPRTPNSHADAGPTSESILRAHRADLLREQITTALAQRNLPLAAMLFRQIHEFDPSHCLPRPAQLDVANQLASEQFYPEAARAYEQFLERYPAFEQIEEVQLMLGLIHARYLARYARARECLTAALARLHDPRKRDLAQAELQRIEPMLRPR